MCNLIARFWDVNAGKITIDGTDVRDFKLDSLMKNISMVFQSVYLFADMHKEYLLAYLNPEKQYELKAFLQTVLFFFENNPALKGIVHSVKSRMKDPEHLKDKIQRKLKSGKIIDENNLFTVVNDLIGVRILYLYQDQFQLIHNELLKKVDETKDWMFVEAPKAYTWDPETREYFEKLNIHTEVRDTYYTSVHYVIRSCIYSNIVVVGTKQRVQYLVEELRETQIVMKEITEQILSGDFSMSGESYKELKEDYLAFVITMVDILNGAAYLFEKKPDSDNRHWKEQQEIQQYCEALGKEIGGKEKQGRKGM